jgi:hypothetical protein
MECSVVTRHRFSVIKSIATVVLLMSTKGYATTYTNDTSVQLVTTQPALSGASSALGYVWFQAGFKLPSSATFTVDIVPPINGQIDMNTGTISLTRDVTLGSDVTLINSGTIVGNSKTIHLGGDLSYSSDSNKTLTISENLTIDGHQNVLTIGSSNLFFIATGAVLTLKNMTLALTTSATAFTLGDATSGLILENVKVLFSDSYTFTTGTITIKGLTSFMAGAPKTFTYSSAGNFTIASNSSLHLDHNMIFKHNYASADNFIFTDRTSRLILVGSTFESAARTLALQLGTIIADHRSYLKGSGGSGNITLGDGTNRLYIIFLPAASIEVNGNTVTYANAN